MSEVFPQQYRSGLAFNTCLQSAKVQLFMSHDQHSVIVLRKRSGCISVVVKSDILSVQRVESVVGQHRLRVVEQLLSVIQSNGVIVESDLFVFMW